MLIDLGKTSTKTTITDVDPAITKGGLTVTMSVTTGAKYSIQVIDLKGDVKNSLGFLANEDTVVKKLNYSSLENGDYALVLVDISGREYKRYITIKH
ncbi:MAG: hypothetical protein EBR30_01810 [Cytophagia bacterium]|nr:hypothetical protein [Cytophagia bacterium]